MKSKTFKEYKVDDQVNDTLTISQKYPNGLINLYTSCGRNGSVRFTKEQIKSIIRYLEELLV